ncbi:hypothetical protein MGSAQ_003050 [marine sediment metagenome]|uniref:Uncharacterized protein n=1 Tax=marine sediment metagenome TaxID=412755 RepID=A0A1B6NPW7_9ZZZZ
MVGLGHSGVIGVTVAMMALRRIPRDHEILLSWRTGLNAVSERTHGLLDLIRVGQAFINGQSQAFGHDADLHIPDARQAGHRAAHLGRAGGAIHSGHCPVAQGHAGFIRIVIILSSAESRAVAIIDSEVYSL